MNYGILVFLMQLNAEFRVMGYDTFAEKAEFYKILMEKFAIQSGETF